MIGKAVSHVSDLPECPIGIVCHPMMMPAVFQIVEVDIPVRMIPQVSEEFVVRGSGFFQWVRSMTHSVNLPCRNFANNLRQSDSVAWVEIPSLLDVARALADLADLPTPSCGKMSRGITSRTTDPLPMRSRIGLT